MANAKELVKTYWKEGLLIAAGIAMVIAGNFTEGGLPLACPGAMTALFGALGALKAAGHRTRVQIEQEMIETEQAMQYIFRGESQAGPLPEPEKSPPDISEA